jgi:hypothetical protein
MVLATRVCASAVMELERAGEIDERMWPCHALEINPRLHIYGCFKYTTSFAIHMVLYLPLVEYMEHEYTSNELLWSSSSEELLCFTYLYLRKN